MEDSLVRNWDLRSLRPDFDATRKYPWRNRLVLVAGGGPGDDVAAGGVTQTQSRTCRTVLQRFAGGVNALGDYHVHQNSDNIWLVLEGTLTAVVGGVRFRVPSNHCIFMPAGVPHATGNFDDDEMIAFELYNPSIFKSDGTTDATPASLPPRVNRSASPHSENGVRVWALPSVVPTLGGGKYTWRGNVRLAAGGASTGADNVSDQSMIILQRFGGDANAMGGYHVHEGSDNIWIVLEGTLTSIIGDRKYETAAGEAIFMPAGVAHATGNYGHGEVRALEFYTPTTFHAGAEDSKPASLPTTIRDAS